jgi:prephenate dehydrogenase
VGLRLKSAGLSVEITDKDQSSMKLAQDLIKSGPIIEPDLIVVAVPAKVNSEVVIQQLKANPNSRVCDLASIKSDLLLEVAKFSELRKNFFSLHPMAGREFSGAENSRADLFDGRAWIAITDSFQNSESKDSAQQLVDLCGGSLYWLTSAEHDQVVARISHLPQILSSALASQMLKINEENLNLAGQGLRDLTRLASADTGLWSQILLENQREIKPALLEMIQKLQQLLNNLDARDINSIEKFIKDGNLGKSKIPGKHGAKNRDYSFLPIVIDDKPGELARIFNECAKISVNIEDLTIEHSPGQETGLITLALSANDCQALSSHLQSLQFKVHPIKNR